MDIKDFNMNYFSLKGKVAIVTGGNTGLGQAFSVAYATAGAKIFAVSLDSKGDVETRKLIEDTGSEVEFMIADITEDGMPQNIIDNCIKKFGQLDIVHNNAGVGINKEFPDFDRKSWDTMIAVNLTAAYEFSNRAGQIFKQQKSGKLIYTGSLFSFLGGEWSPAYAATKHGIAALAKVYCDELARYNVQSNAIAPGYFKTPLTIKTQENPESNQRIMLHSPAERWGDLAELMGTAVFLASNASNFVNGEVIRVDGGYLVR